MDSTEYDIIRIGGKRPSMTKRRSVDMKNLSTITLEDFEPCLGQSFVVKTADADPLELELTQVKALRDPDPATDARQPFALLFRGPLEPVLAQQLLRMENPTLGELTLFLVPVGADENGMLYDASFN
jgi:hypothetical protein